VGGFTGNWVDLAGRVAAATGCGIRRLLN
jgi:hypothetical protein